MTVQFPPYSVHCSYLSLRDGSLMTFSQYRSVLLQKFRFQKNIDVEWIWVHWTQNVVVFIFFFYPDAQVAEATFCLLNIVHVLAYKIRFDSRGFWFRVSEYFEWDVVVMCVIVSLLNHSSKRLFKYTSFIFFL